MPSHDAATWRCSSVPTSDVVVTPPPSLEDLKSRLSLLSGDAAADSSDFQRVASRARQAIVSGRIAAPLSELRVRLAGAGVDGHYVPVSEVTDLLGTIQGAITAMGSSVRKAGAAKMPKDQSGHKVGIRKATQLRMGPEITPGSLVFHLQAAPDIIPTSAPGAMLDGTDESDLIVDLAIRQLLALVESAQADEAGDIGVLTEKIRRYGSMVASKLSQLAEQSLDAQIDIDLGHWSRGGKRSYAVLGSRGAAAIREAAERNRERVESETLTGRLRTVSDGADQIRLTLADDTNLRMTVDPDLGISIRSLLGETVIAEVETKVTWKLASGAERRTRHLIEARLSPEVQTLPVDGL